MSENMPADLSRSVAERDFEIFSSMTDEERAEIEELVEQIISDELRTAAPDVLFARAAKFEWRLKHHTPAQRLFGYRLAAVLRLRAAPGLRSRS